MDLVRYHLGIETPEPGETETIDGIITSMQNETVKVSKAEGGPAVRASHTKTSGLLKGSLVVHDGLAPARRQGLFAQPGSYPVLARLAQGPGERLSDKISTHRGLALKVFGVAGPKIDGHAEDTQDFVLATGPVFPEADAAAFLNSMRQIEAALGGHELLKTAVSVTARILNAAVTTVTGNDVPRLDFFGHAPLHSLAESYHSQAAIRYGDYVAKIALFPVSAEQLARSGETLDPGADPDVFRNATVAYFREHDAVFELRVQLCTDPETMPIEDASVSWAEQDNPYVAVANPDAAAAGCAVARTGPVRRGPDELPAVPFAGSAPAAGLADARQAARLFDAGSIPDEAGRYHGGGADHAGGGAGLGNPFPCQDEQEQGASVQVPWSTGVGRRLVASTVRSWGAPRT